MGLQGRSAGTPLTPEDPQSIGPYELYGRLGSGGMGTVYLARAADGPRVALKAIRRDYAADPVYRARFHEEVSNARKVASFCTARVLDHGEDDGVLYLVTEYIDGISLEDHLIEHGALSPSVLHSAAVGVAAALTAIHAAGLVHRDLKPANVMLTLAGPRVIDFGLARSAHLSSRHTNAGMVMGTPGWIAPEQVFEGRTSPAGDVFAWGSLIAYAGLGGHPFGEGDAYVMAARARTAPPDLRGLPAPLDRLVAAAIHPDPARRPAARQLLLELVGAADEPAAQLAATRHLTNTWDPAEFPPLAGAPANTPGHPGQPPGPQPSPGPGTQAPAGPQAPPSPGSQMPPPPGSPAPPSPGSQVPPAPGSQMSPPPGSQAPSAAAPHGPSGPPPGPQGAPGPQMPGPGSSHGPAAAPPASQAPSAAAPHGPSGPPPGPQGAPGPQMPGAGSPHGPAAGPPGSQPSAAASAAPQPGPHASAPPQPGPHPSAGPHASPGQQPGPQAAAGPQPGPHAASAASPGSQPGPHAAPSMPAGPQPGHTAGPQGPASPSGHPAAPHQGGPGAHQAPSVSAPSHQAQPGHPGPGPSADGPSLTGMRVPQAGPSADGPSLTGLRLPQAGPPADGPSLTGIPLPSGGPPPQGPPPSGHLQQPPHHHSGQGPLPGRQSPGTQGPPPQGPTSHNPSPHGPSSHGPSSHGPSPHGPSSHGPSAPGPSAHGPTAQGPLPGPGRSSRLTGRGPLPPTTMPPPGGARRATFTGCLTAVVIAVVLLVLLVALVAWLGRSPAAVGAERPAQDGRLRFAVTGTTCPKPAKSAAQRTCTVSLKVDNVGKEGRVLYPGQQKLCDEDDVPHAATRLLDKAGKELTPVRIGPGQSFSGSLVFELPKQARPAELELHDSALSHGVRVALGD
ncbi:serine/threonine-protein kinase [Nonomuraea rhodomycinica]|uniref:Protein kinase n=1 Tax=Nonomuraea rhodomycinica TaxID=1712872 RepID=A0A7Y6IJG7_9ACTN|nr:serine/threonine-protein kinase [Nonomuraea rhodomycinica]NUW39156.1 protein kinase [Nonomuraea rhodomycinica]